MGYNEKLNLFGEVFELIEFFHIYTGWRKWFIFFYHKRNLKYKSKPKVGEFMTWLVYFYGAGGI